jgi:RNA ligase (TIGR02306 family)
MTERKLASIQKIVDIQPIEGADAIEKAQINSWWVVVKRGEFNIGDLVIYLEIDSWVPTELAPFLSKGAFPREYNGVKGERLRTVKLRGQISQGLILPIELLVDHALSPIFVEGEDVTDELRIQKWEAPIAACLSGTVRGNFPSEWRKTDQERIQGFSNKEFYYLKQHEYEVTIKLDGSSCSVGLVNDLTYTVCSRNMNLKTDQEGNSFVQVCKKYNLEEQLKAYGRPIQISGELIGEGVQGNKEGIKGQDLYVFDIYDPVECEYLSTARRQELCKQFGLKHVPILANFDRLSDLELNTVDDILKYAEGPSLNAKSREGVVFKAVDGSTSFKAISNSWLLKNDG